MMETVEVRGEFLTVDILLVRRFGYAGQKLLAETLALNSGLSNHGPFIEMGTVLVLPEAPSAAFVSTDEPTISLFD